MKTETESDEVQPTQDAARVSGGETLVRATLANIIAKVKKGGRVSRADLRMIDAYEKSGIEGVIAIASNRGMNAARMRAVSAAEREVGPLPDPTERGLWWRDSCKYNFKLFCEHYQPNTFTMGWSANQLVLIRKLTRTAIMGGLYAVACERSGGKTSIVEAACAWCLLYGHRSFIVLIGSDEGHALKTLDSIKMELATNDRLYESFPEALHPIRCLDGIPNRCGGQICNGKRTFIEWSSKGIVMPTIYDAKGKLLPFSSCVILTTGLTGSIRGMKHKLPNGTVRRPDFVIPDDPQTDESARSESQCEYRESLLSGAVLGLAGPKKKIAGVMPCTVIAPDDMADRLLDRKRHPYWLGDRLQMVKSFPKAMDLWQLYSEIRAESFRKGGSGAEATKFYQERRAKMDEGSVVSWPERFNKDEISGLQHAMNLMYRDPKSFWSEYQNQPIKRVNMEIRLSADIVQAKFNRIPMMQVMETAIVTTGFVDVNDHALAWTMCSWNKDLSGSVIGYGEHVGEGQRIWDERHPLPEGKDQRFWQALNSLFTKLFTPGAFRNVHGKPVIPDLVLVDSNYLKDTILKWCRARTLLGGFNHMPSRGSSFKYFRTKDDGEIIRQPPDSWWKVEEKPIEEGVKIRRLVHDADFHRREMQAAWMLPPLSPKSLTVNGDNELQHTLFAQQVAAEKLEDYAAPVKPGYSGMYAWSQTPGVRNEYCDCVTGARVAAWYLLGVTGRIVIGAPAGTDIGKPDLTAAPLRPTFPREIGPGEAGGLEGW